jgi:hypothetical protein
MTASEAARTAGLAFFAAAGLCAFTVVETAAAFAVADGGFVAVADGVCMGAEAISNAERSKQDISSALFRAKGLMNFSPSYHRS